MIDTSPTVEEVVEVLDKCIIPARQEGFISTLRDGTREARLDRTRAITIITAARECWDAKKFAKTSHPSNPTIKCPICLRMRWKA